MWIRLENYSDICGKIVKIKLKMATLGSSTHSNLCDYDVTMNFAGDTLSTESGSTGNHIWIRSPWWRLYEINFSCFEFKTT